ncbi:MAG: F0F1 ATP synthase subunit beta, partial [Bacteroidota bacterium]|nr:F0F1 ATP synthase subunit beta [Bacteroidota bacterium]
MAKEVKGFVSQIIGPVIDVTFEEEIDLPDIYSSLEVTNDNGHVIVLECQQHIGENTIRAIAMDSTDGLRRGMDVLSDGQPITMPTGEEIRGRLFNVIGESIDGLGEVEKKNPYP